MHPIKIISRLILSATLSWSFLVVLAYTLQYLGKNAWGVFHTGLPLVLFPLNIYLFYKTQGVFKFFKGSSNVQNNA